MQVHAYIKEEATYTLPSSPITIKGASLECVGSYKYLGVWLTSTLNWSLQITEVCKKARRQLDMLYRRFYVIVVWYNGIQRAKPEEFHYTLWFSKVYGYCTLSVV
jgi:hypothetical protein